MPGDRVAIALDSSLGGITPVLRVVVDLLYQSGVEPGDVTVVASPANRASLSDELPQGIALDLHDPTNQRRLAYLATTNEGRRIYLNRHITDADVVIPVGRLGYDPILGYRGPWSAIFPNLSDQETRASYRQGMAGDAPGQLTPRPELDETFEVSWLLGTQFHLGLVPGRSGLAEALGGLAEPLRDLAIGAIDRLWSFRPPTRAECVVAGIGSPGVPTGIDELVEGLVTASRLVIHGGKIVALSRTQGVIGPSLRRRATPVTRRTHPQRSAVTTPTRTLSPAGGWPRSSPGPTCTFTAASIARLSKISPWFPSIISTMPAACLPGRARASWSATPT